MRVALHAVAVASFLSPIEIDVGLQHNMPGGTLQLVFQGSQDLILTGNPSMSFFRSIFRSHSRFAMESMRIAMTRSTANVYDRTQFSVKLPRNADMVSNMYFTFKLPDVYAPVDRPVFAWVEYVAEAAIEEFQLTIGGALVDRQYGEWIRIWNELTQDGARRLLYDKMTGNVTDMVDPRAAYTETRIYPIAENIYPFSDPNGSAPPTIRGRRVYVPLPFWFTKHPGAALPLIGLQYHEIEIQLTMRPIAQLYRLFGSRDGVVDYWAPDATTPSHALRGYLKSDEPMAVTDTVLDVQAGLEVNYIFLDGPERTFFALKPTDHLIEQVTRVQANGLSQNQLVDLVLQNPVKELFWTLQRDDAPDHNAWYDYTDAGGEIMTSAQLLFNGMPRIEEKESTYFTLVQPYQHHSGANLTPGVHCYSMSLHPEAFNPSGSFNASRINRIQLLLRTRAPDDESYTYRANIYAVNYNFLRMSAGMAAVMFAL
jgi:hypothetical protein